MHTKFTSCIMFWTKVTNNVRHVIVPQLFLKGCSVSVTAYIEVLDTGGKPCIGSVDVRDHIEHGTQVWLHETFRNRITFNAWHSIYPDLNPLEYHISGTVEWKTSERFNDTKHSLNVNALIQALSRFQNCKNTVLETQSVFLS